ncbi:hypothetical protein STEG23_026655, partial [Scotinomys teguina]
NRLLYDTNFYPSLVSVALITHDQNQLGKGGLFGLQVTVHYPGKPKQELKVILYPSVVFDAVED